MTKEGGQLEFQKASMKIADILQHYENVKNELANCERELQEEAAQFSADPQVMD